MADYGVIERTIVLRNGLSSEWASSTYVALKGELCYESDSKKFKFGNGIDTYANLDYASATTAKVDTRNPTVTDAGYDIGAIWVNTTPAAKKAFICMGNVTGSAEWWPLITPDDLAELGGGDMLASVFATNADASSGYVDKAKTAGKWETPRTINLTGAVAGSADVDGSANVSVVASLSPTGIIQGAYTKVTVGVDGRVTAGATLSEEDIPNLHLVKIVDAGTAAAKDVGIGAGEIPLLDSNGKLNTSVLPAISITETFVVDSEAAMLALEAETGDVCVRTDLHDSFILKQEPASTLANWQEILVPNGYITSINGKSGAAVTLTTDDVAEGTANQYFTNARADARFNALFPTKSTADLTDGDTVMHTDQYYIIDGGGPNDFD